MDAERDRVIEEKDQRAQGESAPEVWKRVPWGRLAILAVVSWVVVQDVVLEVVPFSEWPVWGILAYGVSGALTACSMNSLLWG